MNIHLLNILSKCLNFYYILIIRLLEEIAIELWIHRLKIRTKYLSTKSLRLYLRSHCCMLPLSLNRDTSESNSSQPQIVASEIFVKIY